MAMSPIDISALPRSMQKRPEVKALALKVYAGDNPRHFRVPGDTTIHEVFLFGGSYKCSCRAAQSGRVCSHSIAVERHCQHNQENV